MCEYVCGIKKKKTIFPSNMVLVLMGSLMGIQYLAHCKRHIYIHNNDILSWSHGMNNIQRESHSIMILSPLMHDIFLQEI